MSESKELFQKGLRDGVAIGVSYIPAAMAISIAASKQNFPFGIWELMSALLYTTSGQAAILNLLSNGTTVIFIYILTFSIMTFRHVLFSLSLSQKLDSNVGIFSRMLFAPFNSDEIYSIVMQQPGKIKSSYLLGISIFPYLGQMLGISAGFLFTQSLPESLKSAMGITLYAVFLALVVPPMRKSMHVVAAVVLAGAISWILECIPAVKSGLPAGSPMIICTLLTCALGAIFMPVNSEDEKLEEEIEKNNI
ncbi:MAG: AzlC family ABC transporter permease [Clostridia bacterium]|nr:AzlC family ABC transporter permease [Clostridia bacterium]